MNNPTQFTYDIRCTGVMLVWIHNHIFQAVKSLTYTANETVKTGQKATTKYLKYPASMGPSQRKDNLTTNKLKSIQKLADIIRLQKAA